MNEAFKIIVILLGSGVGALVFAVTFGVIAVKFVAPLISTGRDGGDVSCYLIAVVLGLVSGAFAGGFGAWKLID